MKTARHALDSYLLCRELASQMRTRALFTIVSLTIALSFSLAGCDKRAGFEKVDPIGAVEVVIPEHGAYSGAFMDFGDEEDDVTLEMIEDFEQMVGKHQAIIASSSYWGEQNFPTANLNVIWRHGSLPLLPTPTSRIENPDRSRTSFDGSALVRELRLITIRMN